MRNYQRWLLTLGLTVSIAVLTCLADSTFTWQSIVKAAAIAALPMIIALKTKLNDNEQ